MYQRDMLALLLALPYSVIDNRFSASLNKGDTRRPQAVAGVLFAHKRCQQTRNHCLSRRESWFSATSTPKKVGISVSGKMQSVAIAFNAMIAQLPKPRCWTISKKR